MDYFQLEWLEFVFKMLVAFFLALPIAWNREHHTRIMGLRTFPLVALGSTAYVLVSLSPFLEMTLMHRPGLFKD